MRGSSNYIQVLVEIPSESVQSLKPDYSLFTCCGAKAILGTSSLINDKELSTLITSYSKNFNHIFKRQSKFLRALKAFSSQKKV